MNRIVKDPYTSYGRCRDRLLGEYNKYKKLIIAVDFDDTIFNTHNNHGWLYPRVVEALIRWQQHADIIVWTASLPDRYELIRSVFTAHGISISGINCNAPQIEARGPKIYANVYLDDRTFGLNDALTALEEIANIKGF